MKEGWKYLKFSDVSTSIEDGDWIESKDQSEDGIRLIQTGNIGVGVYKNKGEKAKYISEETFQRLHCNEVFEGDILISRLPEPVGRACIIPNINCRCITAVDCSIIRIKKNLVMPDWFVYFSQANNYFSQIKNQCTGSTRLRITRKKLCEIKIPVPPLSEQESIVTYLDTAFTKIDAIKQNAEKSLADAKALFQSALKEMMTPKEGWEEKTLKEVGRTQTGTTPSKTDKANYGDYIEFIRPSEIDYDGYGRIDYECEIKLSEQGAGKGRVFSKNSVLMVCIGATIGKVGYSDKEISCNQQINVFTPYDDLDFKFAYYAMKSPTFQHRVIKEGTSSQATLPIINKGKWELLTICYPQLTTQRSIVSHLDSLSSKVSALEANYTKTIAECNAMKQALLRQVFE